MSQVVQAACPGCKSVLQIPSDWVSQAIRCKNCGTVMQAKAPTPPAAPRPVKTPVPASRKASPPPPPPVPVVKPSAFKPTTPVKQAAPTPPTARPVAPSQPGVPSFDFDEPVEDSSPRSSRRGRKKSGNGSWIGLAVLCGILLLGGVVTFAFWPKIQAIVAKANDPGDDDDDRPVAKKEKPSSKSSTPGKKNGEKPRGKATNDPPRDKTKRPKAKPPKDNPKPKPIPAGATTFPRRALIIAPHNYLYANPLPDPLVSINPRKTAIERLHDSLFNGLNVPHNQIFRLSDLGDPKKKESRPPLKTVIEQGLVNFLKTTRKQDRILVFFLGHTKEIDNDAYLVPIEGELEDARTLIPLKWVYDQMAKCECRQKILVLDGNRFNAAQGEERPGSGPMGAKFEAALKSPPPGVQVWSACSAGQQSNEFEEAPLGLFLESFRQGLTPPKGVKGALEGKIQKTDDLIPLAVLNQAAIKKMEDPLDKRKLVQRPLISGNPPLDGVAYDRSEAPAAAPFLPTVTSPNQKLVKDIMDEISLPSLKGGTGTVEDVSFDMLPPFSADALKAYEGELKSDSKLRQAIHDARVILWAVSTATAPRELKEEVEVRRAKLKINLSIMKDKYSKPGAGAAEMAFKNRVYEDGKQMSRIVAELEEVLEKLKEAGKEEKSSAPKRWQANYTYILARFQAQLAFLEEYQSLLGQMRKEFPPHDPAIHNGWRMAAKEKASDSMGKKYDKGARKLYGEAATDFRSTPWEVLAKREKLSALGLEWQPY